MNPYPIPEEPLKLKIHNDGKEKCQSFESVSDMPYMETGYGETREQSVSEFSLKLRTVIGELIHLERCIKNGTVEIVMVGWDGEPL